jgi:magnesium-transporting ATPase (P-type)
LDWLLEGVSFAALIATVVIVASNWTRLSHRPPPRFRVQGAWNPNIVLWTMMAINIGAYMLLTAEGYYQKIISIPAAIDAPQVRQLLFSMMIVLKTVMMLLSVYLVWSMVNVMLGHVLGLSPRFLTLFVVMVPVPLLLYTVKLRRYRR